jgi:hypothetical protein
MSHLKQVCPICAGSGLRDPDPQDPWPCVTCNESGEVYVYAGTYSSSGGFTAAVTLVGHREPPSDDTEFEALSGGLLAEQSSKALDALRSSTFWRDAGLTPRKEAA